MSAVTKHPQGAPCWFELGTSDHKGANAFYSKLFGWSTFEVPIGEGQTYSIYRHDGKDVGAGYALTPEMSAAGVPPNWGVFFCVEDADAASAKVIELGGTVPQPAYDVFDFGRMVGCKDPEGAAFSLWQPKAHIGVGTGGEVHSVCWTELATRDAFRARNFYTGLFGWSTKIGPQIPTYIEFSAGERQYGGILQMNELWDGIPTYWGVYFRVADCDTSAALVRKAGGEVKYGPFNAEGVGRIAVCADPAGAIFSIIHLNA